MSIIIFQAESQDMRWGYALQSNGTNQYVITPDLYSEFNGTSRTIELWFYAETAGIILNEQGAGSLDLSWFDSQIEIVGTTLKVAVWGGIGEHYSIDIGNITFNTWNHVVLRYNHSSNLLEGFLNGVKSGNSISVTIKQPDTGQLFYSLASYTSTNLGSESWFTGKIDEVRFWNDVRTDEEIRLNRWNELTGSESNLVAYYKMNDGSGTSASDNSLNSFTGTLINGPLWVSSTVPHPYSGGDGTSGTPYQITTAADLLYLSQHSFDWSNKYFIQTADIDFSTSHATVDWNGDGTVNSTDNNGFSPIGNSTIKFSGNYNGQNHFISNLYINRFGIGRIGLFGFAYGSSISNLGLVNVSVIGGSWTGALVGDHTNGSSLSNCFSTGSVSGSDNVGGLVGYNQNTGSTISNCYSLANVSGAHYVGGLVGMNNYSGAVSFSYSAGSVSVSADYHGGLVGRNINSATVSNSFWDAQTSGQATSEGGIGLATTEMKTQSTFSDWDFETTPIWQIQSGGYVSYPYLQAFTYDSPGTSPEVNPIPGLAPAPVTWTGATNTDWGITSNWNPEFIPASNRDAIIPASGITNYPVISSGTIATVKNLTNNSTTSNSITVQSGGKLTIIGAYNAVSGAQLKVNANSPN